MDRMNAIRNKVREIGIGEERTFGYMTSIDHFSEDKRCFEKLHNDGEIELIYCQKVNYGTHVKLIRVK